MYSEISKLEANINGKLVHLTCDKDTPTSSIKEAAFQFLKYVGQVEDNAKALEELRAQEAKNQEVLQPVEVTTEPTP